MCCMITGWYQNTKAMVQQGNQWLRPVYWLFAAWYIHTWPLCTWCHMRGPTLTIIASTSCQHSRHQPSSCVCNAGVQMLLPALCAHTPTCCKEDSRCRDRCCSLDSHPFCVCIGADCHWCASIQAAARGQDATSECLYLPNSCHISVLTLVQLFCTF